VARSVTVREIAQCAEVSIATVSRVLNNHDNINEHVKQRVLQAAAQLGYFKPARKSVGQDMTVRNNAERQLKEIGYLFCYSDLGAAEIDPFWAPILYGAEAEAHKAKMRLIYQSIARNQPTYNLQARLHEMRTDGILLVGPSEEETIQAIQALNIPLVLVDNYSSQLEQKVDAVLADNYEGAKLAVKHLISQGHRRIACMGGHISPANNIYTFGWRKEGYCAALREAGIPINTNLILECNLRLPDEIYASCKKLFDSGEPFSAIFCVNDPVASRTIKGLRECGLRVPEDVSVVGFDNVDLAEHLTPPLTTIHVPKEAMGATAIKALEARVAEPQAVNITYTLGIHLVIRDSVRPYQQ
jgi:DNA-binding LacI/PurR family transcriptional regulator